MIKAAGGVVWRPSGTAGGGVPERRIAELSDVEIVVVRRPRYGDVSLPKGKLDPGEKHKKAALREVREETGLDCELGPKLARVSYDTPLGPKRVKWWAMQPIDGAAEPVAGDPGEISEARWVPFGEAWRLLTYGTEREVLAAFAEVVLGVEH